MSSTQTAIQTPTQLLREVIGTLLIPLFLETAGGDLALARAAAHQLLGSHGARTPLELLFTAQAFAFGMAALAVINQPPPEDASPSIALRMRNNASALNRASERCWNTVERSLQNWLPYPPDDPEPPLETPQVETAQELPLPATPSESDLGPTAKEILAPVPPWQRWEDGLKRRASTASSAEASSEADDQPAPVDADASS
jgi:hypothetical protein